MQIWGESPDTAALGAAYAFGIARNHPFLDGNKRTAFVVMELFLNLNGWTLEAEDSDCISTMEGVASGELSENSLVTWLQANSARE